MSGVVMSCLRRADTPVRYPRWAARRGAPSSRCSRGSPPRSSRPGAGYPAHERGTTSLLASRRAHILRRELVGSHKVVDRRLAPLRNLLEVGARLLIVLLRNAQLPHLRAVSLAVVADV